MSFKFKHNADKISIDLSKYVGRKIIAVESAIDKFIKNTEADAKRNISSNGSIYESKLINSFKKKVVKSKGKGEWSLKVDAVQGAFVEFGTKGKFRANPKLGNYPNQFKGMKGESGDVYERLEKYLLSEGVPENEIFTVIKSILNKGTKAYPFFFPAVFKNKLILRKDLRRAIKKRNKR
tara:strand:+ start:1358 stop:1894 length:537 start_codon:yes stop_codon:yes gene_type:complete